MVTTQQLLLMEAQWKSGLWLTGAIKNPGTRARAIQQCSFCKIWSQAMLVACRENIPQSREMRRNDKYKSSKSQSRAACKYFFSFGSKLPYRAWYYFASTPIISPLKTTCQCLKRERNYESLSPPVYATGRLEEMPGLIPYTTCHLTKKNEREREVRCTK